MKPFADHFIKHKPLISEGLVKCSKYSILCDILHILQYVPLSKCTVDVITFLGIVYYYVNLNRKIGHAEMLGSVCTLVYYPKKYTKAVLKNVLKLKKKKIKFFFFSKRLATTSKKKIGFGTKNVIIV